MARSVFGTLALASTVLFAAPIALAGAFEVAAGDYVLGGVFFAVAALMIALEEYLFTPSDLPAAALGKVASVVAKPPEEEREEGEED